MQADLFYQLLNPLVFLVFALGFFAIDRIRADMAAGLIAASYVLGAIAFTADIFLINSNDMIIRTVIAALYAGTAVLIVGGCNIYYRNSAPWKTFGIMLAAHLVLYTALLALKMDWIRSLVVNFGVGLIFLVGLIRIRHHMAGRLDKLLFIVGAINCAQCFIRPIGIALLEGGTFDVTTHDETTFFITLQLFMAVSAIATAMSMFLVLGRDMLEAVQNRSDTDPLTGILNRRGLEKKAAPLLAGAKHQPVCAIVADIDKFKNVNDTYGHASGDQIIQALSKIMADIAPDMAVAARLGGEEFIIIAPDTDLVEAHQLANTVRRIFEASSVQASPDLIKCTASFGVAEAKRGETLEQLTIRADRALYLAKNAGRNCIKCQIDVAIYKLRQLHQELQRHAPHRGNEHTTKSAARS